MGWLSCIVLGKKSSHEIKQLQGMNLVCAADNFRNYQKKVEN